jgi:hypothetical protein
MSTASSMMRRRCCGLNLLRQVGGIEHDANPVRLHLLDQAAGGRGGTHHIGKLRLDAQHNAMRLGNADGGFEGLQHVAPGFG